MMTNLEKELSEKSDVAGVYLHMHVLNKVGLRFYEACGFTVDERLENYYTDLEEPHCLVLLKEITHPKKEQGKP